MTTSSPPNAPTASTPLQREVSPAPPAGELRCRHSELAGPVFCGCATALAGVCVGLPSASNARPR